MNLATRYVLPLLCFLMASQGLKAQTWQNPYQERLDRFSGKDYEQVEIDLKKGQPVKVLFLNDYSNNWGASITQFVDVEQVIIEVSVADSVKLLTVFEQLSRLPALKYLNLNVYINGSQPIFKIPAGLNKLKNLEVLSIRIGGNVDFSTILTALPYCKNLAALRLELPETRTDFPAVLLECKSLKLLNILLPQEMNLPAWLGQIKSLEYLTLYSRFSENMMKKPVLPDFLSGLIALKGLEITNFMIKEGAIKRLSSSLQYISIGNCILSESDELMTTLNDCKGLEYLYMRGTMLSPFSEATVSRLPNLKELILSDLYIDSLRKQPLASVPDFSQSKQLKLLDIEKILGETAPRWIEQLTNLESLKLIGNRLTKLPDLGKMVNLKYLIVPYNQLKELPNSIGKLLKLKTLNITNNQITELPEGLSNAAELQLAFLTNNQLMTLPRAFVRLKKLKELHISDNRLTELPQNLGECHELRNLLVVNNALKTLPNSIGQLKSLTNLHISHNPLTQLPENLGDCDSLEHLSAYNCRLETLPNSIGKLQRLTILNMTDAEYVPGNYRHIKGDTRYLAKNHNQLRSLPTSLADCRQLKMLDLSQNKYWDEKALWPVIQRLHMPEGTVNLSGCNLNAIPITGWLDTQIQSLALAGNQIAQFPPDWFKARGIKTIVLNQNKLLPRSMNREYDSFEERLLLGEEMGVEVPKPFPKTKEMARAYLKWAERKVNLGDIPRFVEYMKEAQQIDSSEVRYRLELWSRFYFHTKQYRRAIDSINVFAGRYSIFDKAQSKSSSPRYLPSVPLVLIDIRGQSKWKLGDSLGAIKDYEMLLEEKNFSDPNLWTRLAIWYKHYRPTAGKSGAAFDKAINKYEAVQNQPPLVQLSVAEVYFMNDQADKAYEYLFGLDRSTFKTEEKLLADYLLLAAQIAQKQAGEDEIETFEKRLKTQELKIKDWSYQLFEEALDSLEYPKEQKALISRLTNAMKAQSVLVD